MIRALVFDFNGVLVDDEPLHCDLFREVLEPDGVRMTLDLYHERYFGYDDRKCMEVALRDFGVEPTAGRIEELVALKARRYLERAESELIVFPHASACLKGLGARYPMAICSGALRQEIELGLRRLEARELVPVIVPADDGVASKPDPEGYVLAWKGLRERANNGSFADLKPEECLVIEDSAAGIQAARGAGMRVIGIPNSLPADALREAGAEAIVTSLSEYTPEWIARTFA